MDEHHRATHPIEPDSQKIADARSILKNLGLPAAQLNDRSALTLLALLDLRPETLWSAATSRLIGITPIMDWCRLHYKADYAPNTRETFRRQTMHQFIQAGFVELNPDKPDRPVNSPKAVYRITDEALHLFQQYQSLTWQQALEDFQAVVPELKVVYAKQRGFTRIPIQIKEGYFIDLSAGSHSELISDIIEQFAPRFVPGAHIIYVGDTGKKWGYFDSDLLTRLGVSVDSHGKMPDVILFYPEKQWLILAETVTNHGPVDSKRHAKLARIFGTATVGLIYVTAFPTRAIMARYLTSISWETEVWVAEDPDHLIHFNGTRFLGPHRNTQGD